MTFNLSSLDLESIGYLRAMQMRYSGRLLRLTTIQVRGETKVVVFDAQHTLRFVLDDMPSVEWLSEQSALIERDIAVRYQEHLRNSAYAEPEPKPKPSAKPGAKPSRTETVPTSFVPDPSQGLDLDDLFGV